MKPIQKPKTFKEFTTPSILIQRQLIEKIMLAANTINQNNRSYAPGSFMMVSSNLHDQIEHLINWGHGYDNGEIVIFKHPNGNYTAGIDPIDDILKDGIPVDDIVGY